jgi:hypothetical protein
VFGRVQVLHRPKSCAEARLIQYGCDADFPWISSGTAVRHAAISARSVSVSRVVRTATPVMAMTQSACSSIRRLMCSWSSSWAYAAASTSIRRWTGWAYSWKAIQ